VGGMTSFAPTAKEAIAVQLHHQGRSMAQIQANTGLDREQILAAVDRDATRQHQHPNAVPPPPPIRNSTLRKPTKAAEQPIDRDEKIRQLTALIDGVRKHLAAFEAELAALLDAEPSAAGPDPALAESDEVREWAVSNGWVVPAEGERLPGGIVAAYVRAHGGAR